MMKKPELNWAQVHSQLEKEQKAGASSLVLRQIQGLPWRRMSKRWRIAFANLARRAGGPLLSLKILNHGRDPWRNLQSDPEKLAYAAGLFALGNRREATQWLGKIRATEIKNEGLFFQALAFMREWDYQQAYEAFQNYLAEARPIGYRELVVRLNIVACLVALERESETVEKIDSLRLDLQRENASLLLSNLDEIEMQMQRPRTGHPGTLSHGVNRGTESHQLFAEKWQILAEANVADPASFLQSLEKLRVKARKVGHWETIRDLDYRQVQKMRDRNLYAKLHWGTPHAAFRLRLQELAIPLGEDLALGPSTGRQQRERWLNPWDELGIGSLNERLFRALMSDLYRPLNMGEIFEKTHPDERFNPDTSPARIRRGLQRLQKWLKSRDWGISVITRKGAFGLAFHQPIILRVPSSPLEVEQLKEAFGDAWFSRQAVQKHLQMSERTARRFLSQMVDKNLLEKRGANRDRRYRLFLFAQKSQ